MYAAGMCMNCLSNAEATLVGAAAVAYAVKPRVHRALAQAGLVREPDPVAHDVTTVAFLRSLELDPVEILGAEAVAAAAAWVEPVQADSGVGALVARNLASARPIGSHSLATAK